MESEEGTIGTDGLDFLLCHPVIHILIQAENRQRLLAKGRRDTWVYFCVVFAIHNVKAWTCAIIPSIKYKPKKRNDRKFIRNLLNNILAM